MTEYERTKALAAEIHAEYGVVRKEALELAIKIRANEIAGVNSEDLCNAINKLRETISYKRFSS